MRSTDKQPDSGSIIVWTLLADSPLLWQRFENGCLLFNTGSGTTHLLNDPVPDILTELQSAPATVVELLDRLDLGSEDEQVVHQLSALLQDLDQLGLVWPENL
ncbi:MAG: HPr-rel-A system PqqD family peptide chaperone [Magnetococcales bacterium]|nr:HPr-rel-A system PqqD family peptide chaperone [Magnetococcales bacterium]